VFLQLLHELPHLGVRRDHRLLLRRCCVSGAPVAPRNLTAWHHGQPLTLSRDRAANDEGLSRRYGVEFARFWARGVELGARAWALLPNLHFPPRGPADLIGAARNPDAWRLLPALATTTADELDLAGASSADSLDLLDELLLVSTQAPAHRAPWLFGALGLEYLQRPLYLPDGGLASLVERLAQVFVARGGELRLGTPVTRFFRRGSGFGVDTSEGTLEAPRLALNLTHWDALRLADGDLKQAFSGTVRRHPDAWAACTLHLGVQDVFGPEVAPYHQVLLERPLAVTGARSAFVSLSRSDDPSLAPQGHRAVTVSCHAPAAGWEGLSVEAHAARKAEVGAALFDAIASVFPAVRSAHAPVVMPGTPRTWAAFTGRHGGRVGGLPFSFDTLARGFPTGRTGVPGLVRVGDTVFPGQSVAACAWGARRVVAELLAR
jgi:phytoene dehydrogenase-like protein